MKLGSCILNNYRKVLLDEKKKIVALKCELHTVYSTVYTPCSGFKNTGRGVKSTVCVLRVQEGSTYYTQSIRGPMLYTVPV